LDPQPPETPLRNSEYSSIIFSMNQILRLGAFELADQIKKGRLSPVEVMEVFIAQAEKWQPKINALVQTFFDEARRQAKEKEAFLAHTAPDDLPPLFGVPFSCKEMLAVNGARRTGGSIHRKDFISHETATIVERVQKAGAILLGTTNVPELGFWFETDNMVYGRTNNPHNLERTSGGSSGGEAALLAARGSAFGLGSDIGGSIRIPAFFCGVYGHKPSSRLTPITGHFPFSNEQIKSLKDPYYPYTATGPLAFKAEDLYGLLQIIKGPDGIDPKTNGNIKLKPLVRDVSKLKIYSLPSPSIFMTRRTAPYLKSVVEQAAQYLGEIGCEIQPFPRDFFVKGVDLWFKALAKTKQTNFAEALNPYEGIALTSEFFRLAVAQVRHTFPSLATALLEKVTSGMGDDFTEAEKELARMKMHLHETLGDNGVLLLPTHPRTAPPHRSPWYTPFDFVYAGIFTVLDVPVTACPLGVNDNDLPTGLQIVAGFGEDHLTISVAMALEAAFGGSILPSEDELFLQR
jgi:fatty acid amide hydrolase 2